MIRLRSTGDFAIAPEGEGKAVCVDVTPLQRVQTPYGEKEKFRFVFELDEEGFGCQESGRCFAVWSAGFTPSSHEKSALSKFLRCWLGEKMPRSLEDFDVESLIGRPARIIVRHMGAEGRGPYANIVACLPEPGEFPLRPSGFFVRKQDRERRAMEASAAETGCGCEDWQHLRIHVGMYKGVCVGDLDEQTLRALYESWAPLAFGARDSRPSACDWRLRSALESAIQLCRKHAGSETETIEF